MADPKPAKSGKQHPPPAGAHAPQDIHTIKGGASGPQWTHESLKQSWPKR